MENENTYYLLGYDQDVVEETLLLAEGEKHPQRPITMNVMELVHLLHENKKGARHVRLLNEERKREKVRENKRRSREKKRHLKKLLKMKEVCFFIFTDGCALCVICGLPEQSFPCGTSFHRENDHGSHENEIASFGATVIIIYLILHKNHNAIFNVTFFYF